ncbi:MAG: ABC transporter ATP-binding protein [Planctomycetota bacterium]
MQSFRRVFGYVWPQWHRLIIIVLSAILIGVLYSLSFATISPLLTVMMGEEGLIGFVNRRIVSDRYDVDFYVSDEIDLSDPNNPQVAYYLHVAKAEHGGAAELAGLRKDDRIIGAGSSIVANETDRFPSRRLMRELVVPQAGTSIPIQIKRMDPKGNVEVLSKILKCGGKPFYADYAQRLLQLLPPEDSKDYKRQAIVFIILLMLVVTIVRCIARFYQDYTGEKVVSIALTYLREDAFDHAMDIPVGFFGTEGSSDSVSRLIRDTAAMGNGMKMLLGKALREPIKAMGLLITALMIDRNLTLIFMCGAPVSLLVLGKLGKKMRRATTRSLQYWAVMLGKLEEVISGIKVVKVYNRQDYERDSYKGINRKLLKQELRMAKVDAAVNPIMESLGMIAASIGLMFGAVWVFSGTMPAPNFFVLLFCLGGAAESARRTSDIWNKLQQANAAAERVYEMVDQAVETEAEAPAELGEVWDKIELRDVSFSYPKSEKIVLKDINIEVPFGHNVAIVGPNGSGKTTLVNLLPRFYDADKGEILIGGTDIRDISLHSLRDKIAMVTQDVVTFNDTVAANIAYGREGASMDEIIGAAKRAFVHEFVEPLPEGYNTKIGERGSGFSGGQLQRIAIARAILKNPTILIFDEAMSQVDSDSEAKIREAMEELALDRTSFVIAHRFSTVIKADRILVMNEGQIIARGRHEELLESCPLYRNLYDTQLLHS